MKRLLLAGLLVLPFALSREGARAERDDAYGSLVGMADSASSDRGPQAGEIPPDNASAEAHRAAGAPSGVAPKNESGSAPSERPKKAPASAAKRETLNDDDAPTVAVPAGSSPRVWTKLFASLVPSMSRPSFEVALSTSARRPPPATPASAAGAAQGLLELVAAATAPYGAEVPLPDAVMKRPTAPDVR